ncbi:uncharacterized protein LOC119337665 isoform X2 [Triticum dicoccoides]|uniref:uncharacterized protein LOC119337665 isoform X2 n=1 Tax=Triticum dicoccoides TaxID=85692 RepID=UPI00188E02FF|nr:uncharacterized protein LOC119337665 isoform X2 [Triticum dicoccoides]
MLAFSFLVLSDYYHIIVPPGKASVMYISGCAMKLLKQGSLFFSALLFCIHPLSHLRILQQISVSFYCHYGADVMTMMIFCLAACLWLMWIHCCHMAPLSHAPVCRS